MIILLKKAHTVKIIQKSKEAQVSLFILSPHVCPFFSIQYIYFQMKSVKYIGFER